MLVSFEFSSCHRPIGPTGTAQFNLVGSILSQPIIAHAGQLAVGTCAPAMEMEKARAREGLLFMFMTFW